MLLTIVLLVFTAASPVFSAPVPSTELTRRQGSADAASVPHHDKLFSGAPRRQEGEFPGGNPGAVPVLSGISGSPARPIAGVPKRRQEGSI